MSSRTQEFMTSAHERLAGARDCLKAKHVELAVSAAYYAMLYAARAALAERGEYAKTHQGVWTRFSNLFVLTSEIDRGLFKVATRAQDARKEGDYEAVPISAEIARELIDGAADFLDAVAALLQTSDQQTGTDPHAAGR